MLNYPVTIAAVEKFFCRFCLIKFFSIVINGVRGSQQKEEKKDKLIVSNFNKDSILRSA